MKNIFVVAVMFMVTNTYGQTLPNGQLPGFSVKPGVPIYPNDTILRVVNVNKLSSQKLPAIYVNGRLVGRTFIIDPKHIDSVHVDDDSLQIGNVKYYGRIHITTSNQKIISLTELKEKYTNLKNEPALFMVDGEIITSDYDEFVVDENFLWRIFIDKIENGDVNLNFIKLLTRSEENLKKPVEIRIRGSEVGMTK